MTSDESRFWSKVEKSGGEDACWIWTAGVQKKGYGQIWWKGRCRLSHQVSYEIHFGSRNGMCVMHSCDNPRCVNPNHLSLGTISDNHRDMVSKSRNARGEMIGSSKINAKIASKIRREYKKGGIPQRDIASRFGISKAMVSNIVNGKNWNAT